MFKDRFVEILQKSGKTAKEISRETGIKESSISDYKKGTNQPTVNNLIKLSEYFNISIDYLLERTDEKEPKYRIENHSSIYGDIEHNENENLKPLEKEMLAQFRKLSKIEQLKEIENLINKGDVM